MAEKPSNPQAKANSLPRQKPAVTRVSSTPLFSRNSSGWGAELRRRSDCLFHSTEQLSSPKDETDSGRLRFSSLSSEDEEKNRRRSSTTSPDQPRIDAWLEWRSKRHNSTPALNLSSSVGTSVWVMISFAGQDFDIEFILRFTKSRMRFIAVRWHLRFQFKLNFCWNRRWLIWWYWRAQTIENMMAFLLSWCNIARLREGIVVLLMGGFNSLPGTG